MKQFNVGYTAVGEGTLRIEAENSAQAFLIAKRMRFEADHESDEWWTECRFCMPEVDYARYFNLEHKGE